MKSVFAGLLLAIASSPIHAQQITIENAVIVDALCTDQPWKLAPDGVNITHEPQKHTRGCMKDIKVCWDSNFTILIKNASGSNWPISYRMDAYGNDAFKAWLLTTTKKTGFYANITGAVEGTSTQYANFSGGKLKWVQGEAVPILKVSELIGGDGFNSSTPGALDILEQAAAGGNTPAPGAEVPFQVTFSATQRATYQVDNEAKPTKITFTVENDANTWFAMGLSSDGTMNNGGLGSDIVICSGGEVKRYWVTQKSQPTNGVAIEGASCTQGSGGSKMVFTRALAADNAQQIAIAYAGNTPFIYAHGDADTVNLAFHGSNTGGLSYNLERGTGAGVLKVSASALIWIHAMFMIFSWGLLLPFGVSFARYNRNHPNGPGFWFKVHQRCQYTGWLMQIVGFAGAVAYVQDGGSGHFQGTYQAHMIIGLLVVIVGTLQPLNAVFRPHPHEDKDPTRNCSDKRTCWEYLHKSCGYFAVIFGMVNTAYGIFVAKDKNFEDSFFYTVLVLGVLCMVSMLLYNVVMAFRGKEDPRNS